MPMSTESLNRTSNVIETPIKVNNVDVLKQKIKIENIRTKRTCINDLKRKLHDSRKKDRFRNTIVACSILFSVGLLSFIVG